MKKYIALVLGVLCVMLLLSSCANQKPKITDTTYEYQNDIISCLWLDKLAGGATPVTISLTEEDEKIIRAIWKDCNWDGEAFNCGYDFEFIVGDNTILYCLVCGTLTTSMGCENLSSQQQRLFESCLAVPSSFSSFYYLDCRTPTGVISVDKKTLLDTDYEELMTIISESSWDGEYYDCGHDVYLHFGEQTIRYCSSCGTLESEQGAENLTDEKQARLEALLQYGIGVV